MKFVETKILDGIIEIEDHSNGNVYRIEPVKTVLKNQNLYKIEWRVFGNGFDSFNYKPKIRSLSVAIKKAESLIKSDRKKYAKETI